MWVLLELELECWSLWREELKTGEPEEKPLEQDENQQQNQPKHATRHESNPGYTGGLRAPSLIRYEGIVRFD